MSGTVLESSSDKKQVINKPIDYIKEINLTQWKDACCDETFQRMKRILGTKYLTLDEITEKYSQIYENKSKPSINRYLKDLEEKNLVHIAGRVIKPDQKASEKLYAISSYILYVDNQFKQAWSNEERGIELAEKIASPLQEKFKTGFNAQKIFNLLSNYENIKFSKSKELLEGLVAKAIENNDESALKILSELNNLKNDEVIVFYSNLRFISWFLFDTNLESFIGRLKVSSGEKKKDYKLDSDLHKPSDSLLIEQDPDYLYMPNDFKRDPLYFTHFDNWLKFMMDIRYGSILKLLQANDHPLSLPEIYKKFTTAFNLLNNKFLCYTNDAKDVDKLNIKLNDYLTKTKEQQITIDLESKDAELLSESTIYRLVQDLKESGLVVEAGLRVKNNSPKDQILYTSIAKTIIYFEDSDEFWLQEETWKKASSLIQRVLESAFNKKITDSDKFHDIFTDLEKKRFKSFKKSLLEPNSTNIVNFFFSSLNNTELNALMDAMGTTYYFNANDGILQTKKDLLDLFQ